MSGRVGVIAVQLDKLTLKATEEIFNNNVVIRITLTGLYFDECEAESCTG